MASAIVVGGAGRMGRLVREELLARGATPYIVSSKGCSKEGDAFVFPEVRPEFAPFPEIAFGQLLSYLLSIRRGLNVDKPRNLAKSVTVH